MAGDLRNLLLGTLGVLALIGTRQAVAEAASAPTVTVLVHNQTTASEATLHRAEEEVSRIFQDAGVGIVWADPVADARYSRINPIANTLGTFTSQIIIRPRAAASPSVLGTTIGDVHDTGGSAFVFYDRVVRLAHEQGRDVAMLLGYAVAHEIGHLMLPHPAHAEVGIMRAGWDGDDLRHAAGGSLGFTRAQAALIQSKASRCCALVAAGATP